MLLILILVVAITWFAMINSSEKATVSLGTENLTFYDVPLVLLLFEAFVLGALVWFVVAIFHEVSLRNAMRKLRRENADLQKEIAGLRHISLDSIEEEGEVIETQ
jgi:uncharacterized integral membrane protein